MAEIHKIDLERLHKIDLERQSAGSKLPEHEDEEEFEITDDGAVAEDDAETDDERQARKSEKAFDQALTRLPPG